MCTTVFARHAITVGDLGGDGSPDEDEAALCAPARRVGQFSLMRHPRLLVLEAEVVAAMSAAVAALDIALESLAYSDALSAPTAERLGIGRCCVGDLQEQIVDALGSTPALELRRLSALLSVVSSLERIALNCAAIADLVPDLATALDGDRATRRTIELAGVDTRARLVRARDFLQTWSSWRTGMTPSGWTRGTGGLRALAAVAGRLPHGSSMAAALPLLVDHLGHIDDEADEIAEIASVRRSRWATPPLSAGVEAPLALTSSGSAL
jgi:hypothetical protein